MCGGPIWVSEMSPLANSGVTNMTATVTFGFIGLGVMGEPMCRHLVQKTGAKVLVHDINPEPVVRLVQAGAVDAGSVAAVAKADIVFISMPSGVHLKKICEMT